MIIIQKICVSYIIKVQYTAEAASLLKNGFKQGCLSVGFKFQQSLIRKIKTVMLKHIAAELTDPPSLSYTHTLNRHTHTY